MTPYTATIAGAIMLLVFSLKPTAFRLYSLPKFWKHRIDPWMVLDFGDLWVE